MAELDVRTALDQARQMTSYVQSFNGQKFDSVFDEPDRRNLAVALDHLEETAAMLLNVASRLQQGDAEMRADALFRRRVPEAAARQCATVLMNLLECQYATLEGLPARTSKAERRRQQSICDTYLAQVIDLDIPEDTRGLRDYECGRVREAMRAARQSSAGGEGQP